MTDTENIYRAILLKISMIPVSYLEQVDAYLHHIMQESAKEKQENRKNILALAGSWEDMSESSFNEYLESAKKTGEEMFQNRDITL